MSVQPSEPRRIPDAFRLGFAERVKRLRDAKGLSQLDLARMLDKSRSAIAQWEIGNALPDLSDFERLADCLGSTPQFIAFGISDDPTSILIPVVDYSGSAKGHETGAIALDRQLFEAHGASVPIRPKAIRLTRNGMFEDLRQGDLVVIDEGERQIVGQGETVLIFDQHPEIAQVRAIPGQPTVVALQLGSHMVQVTRDALVIVGRVIATVASRR